MTNSEQEPEKTGTPESLEQKLGKGLSAIALRMPDTGTENPVPCTPAPETHLSAGASQCKSAGLLASL